MNMEYTPEEIAYIHDRNENFHGTDMNFEKVQLYYAIKKDRDEFYDRCEQVLGTGEFDPNPNEKHALMWMDISPILTMRKDDVEVFTRLIARADRVLFVSNESGLRISMVIENIWNS